MRVLFVTGSLVPGGAELHLLNLLEALASTPGMEKHLVYFAGGSLEDRYRDTGVFLHPVLRGKGPFPVKLLRVCKGLSAVAKKVMPDVVHSQLPQSNLLTCFALGGTGIPIVLSERGLGQTRPFWEKALRRRAYGQASYFVANTGVTRQRMISREGVSPGAVSVINNIVKVPDLAPHDLDRVREELNPQGRFRILTAVGGLRPVKGYDVLLRAFSSVISKEESARLFLVGEGSERSCLLELIGKLNLTGKARLLGHRSDVWSILAASDMLISSSHSEGQSNSILEAMASGVPVVATSAGGTRELLAGGNAGVLVNPNSPKELAEAILQVIGDPSGNNARIREARAIVTKDHSEESIRKQYLAIYASLLDEGSR